MGGTKGAFTSSQLNSPRGAQFIHAGCFFFVSRVKPMSQKAKKPATSGVK